VILEALAVAGGLAMAMAKMSVYWKRKILDHPWVFDICVLCLLLWIHGGSADGALIATISAGALSGVHYLLRTYVYPH